MLYNPLAAREFLINKIQNRNFPHEDLTKLAC